MHRPALARKSAPAKALTRMQVNATGKPGARFGASAAPASLTISKTHGGGLDADEEQYVGEVWEEGEEGESGGEQDWDDLVPEVGSHLFPAV